MTTSVIGQGLLVPTTSPGFADIVGFGLGGVEILRNGFDLKPFTAMEQFGYNQGWRVDDHVRLLGHMANKDVADIVGFGDDGVSISFNNGNNTFQPKKLVVNDFGYNAGGWRVETHLRFVADIRKVGRCDIIGFGGEGVAVSQNNGDGNFSPVEFVLNEFGSDQGWQIDIHPRFLAIVTGKWIPDIVGFSQDAVIVALNNGDGTFAPGKTVLNDFTLKQGWYNGTNPRFLADLTGEGWVDIIGFGDQGVYVSMNDGNGNFGKVNKVIDSFGIDQGWKANHPRFIADLRATQRGDIIGFGEDGVYVSFNNGDGTFDTAKLVLQDFGTKQGWQDKYPRFVADLTGDGCADIIGFGDQYVVVAYNDGKGGFGASQKLTQTFAFNNSEWDIGKTVRYVANLGLGRSRTTGVTYYFAPARRNY